MNEEQREFLRRWYRAHQAQQKRVALTVRRLEEALSRLDDLERRMGLMENSVHSCWEVVTSLCERVTEWDEDDEENEDE